MALEISGTLLYVAKISYQSNNWFGHYKKVDQNFTQTDTDTHTEEEFIIFFLIHCYLETLQNLGHIASRVFVCTRKLCISIVV